MFSTIDFSQIFEENPEIDENGVWNCDELAFPTDPLYIQIILYYLYTDNFPL